MKGGLFRGLGELRGYKRAAISAGYGTGWESSPGLANSWRSSFPIRRRGFSAHADAIRAWRAGRSDRIGDGEQRGAGGDDPGAALGVPGEALTAMMMVVFFDAGIKPGPDIFENSSDFLFSLFIALLMVNLLVVVTLMFCTKYIAKMVIS